MNCERESDAIRAGQGESMSDAVRTHIATCGDCAEVMRVASALRRLATIDANSSIPAASKMWWKAQLVRRLGARAQVERPLQRIEWLQVALGAAAAIVLILWQVPTLARSFPTAPTEPTVALPLVVAAAPVQPLAVLAFAGAVLMLVVAVGFWWSVLPGNGRRRRTQ